MAFPKYDTYKETQIDWLGVIPESWELKKLGSLFDERKMKVSDKDFPPLSVTKKGILPQLESAAKTNDNDNRKLVKKGDFVINSRSDRKGSSGLAKEDGSVSLINIVLKPREVYPQFSEYLLKSYGFIEEFYRHGHGIVADLWTTRFAEMKSIYVPHPDLNTQTRIAGFLDKKTVAIDDAIAKKQRLIDLLKEQKAIQFEKAIAFGLERFEAKETGNVFFPQINSSYELVKLGYLCNKVVDGPHFSPNYVDEGVLFLSARNIRDDGWNFSDTKYISQKDYAEFSKRVIPEIGDVLYTKGGTTGVAKVVDLNFHFQVWVHVAVLKIKHSQVNPHYLAFALNTHSCYAQSQLYTRGATNQDLGLTRMINIVLPLPNLKQQNEIANFLSQLQVKYKNLINNISSEIEKLQEYKQTLIAHAVTGKIKVS